ncbi:unnamed protein product [Closterium sp. NIES-54]
MPHERQQALQLRSLHSALSFLVPYKQLVTASTISSTTPSYANMTPPSILLPARPDTTPSSSSSSPVTHTRLVTVSAITTTHALSSNHPLLALPYRCPPARLQAEITSVSDTTPNSSSSSPVTHTRCTRLVAASAITSASGAAMRHMMDGRRPSGVSDAICARVSASMPLRSDTDRVPSSRPPLTHPASPLSLPLPPPPRPPPLPPPATSAAPAAPAPEAAPDPDPSPSSIRSSSSALPATTATARTPPARCMRAGGGASDSDPVAGLAACAASSVVPASPPAAAAASPVASAASAPLSAAGDS